MISRSRQWIGLATLAAGGILAIDGLEAAAEGPVQPAKQTAKTAVKVVTTARQGLAAGTVPSLDECLRDLRRQYSVVEYQKGFPTRADAEAQTRQLVKKLEAGFGETSEQVSGYKTYRERNITKFLAFAAAKWEPPFSK